MVSTHMSFTLIYVEHKGKAEPAKGTRLGNLLVMEMQAPPCRKFKINLEYDIGLHIIGLDSFFKSCR